MVPWDRLLEGSINCFGSFVMGQQVLCTDVYLVEIASGLTPAIASRDSIVEEHIYSKALMLSTGYALGVSGEIWTCS